MINGKGIDPRHYPLITEEEQWESMEERYELLRRLWREEDMTCRSLSRQ